MPLHGIMEKVGRGGEMVVKYIRQPVEEVTREWKRWRTRRL